MVFNATFNNISILVYVNKVYSLSIVIYKSMLLDTMKQNPHFLIPLVLLFSFVSNIF